MVEAVAEVGRSGQMGVVGIAWGPQQRAGTRLQNGPGCQICQDLDVDTNLHDTAASINQPKQHNNKRRSMLVARVIRRSAAQAPMPATREEEVLTLSSPKEWLPASCACRFPAIFFRMPQGWSSIAIIQGASCSRGISPVIPWWPVDLFSPARVIVACLTLTEQADAQQGRCF